MWLSMPHISRQIFSDFPAKKLENVLHIQILFVYLYIEKHQTQYDYENHLHHQRHDEE